MQGPFRLKIALGILSFFFNLEFIGFVSSCELCTEVGRAVLLSPLPNPFEKYPTLTQIKEGSHNYLFYYRSSTEDFKLFSIVDFFYDHPFSYETRIAAIMSIRSMGLGNDQGLESLDRLVCRRLSQQAKLDIVQYRVGEQVRTCQQNI